MNWKISIMVWSFSMLKPGSWLANQRLAETPRSQNYISIPLLRHLKFAASRATTSQVCLLQPKPWNGNMTNPNHTTRSLMDWLKHMLGSSKKELARFFSRQECRSFVDPGLSNVSEACATCKSILSLMETSGHLPVFSVMATITKEHAYRLERW